MACNRTLWGEVEWVNGVDRVNGTKEWQLSGRGGDMGKREELTGMQ